MVNTETRPLFIVLAAMIGICGCTVQTYRPVSVPLTYTQIGSVVPVFNPPPNTPFRCVGTPVAISLFSVPGDPLAYPAFQ